MYKNFITSLKEYIYLMLLVCCDSRNIQVTHEYISEFGVILSKKEVMKCLKTTMLMEK
jgi:hypothetical protein